MEGPEADELRFVQQTLYDLSDEDSDNEGNGQGDDEAEGAAAYKFRDFFVADKRDGHRADKPSEDRVKPGKKAHKQAQQVESDGSDMEEGSAGEDDEGGSEGDMDEVRVFCPVLVCLPVNIAVSVALLVQYTWAKLDDSRRCELLHLRISTGFDCFYRVRSGTKKTVRAAAKKQGATTKAPVPSAPPVPPLLRRRPTAGRPRCPRRSRSSREN
jgi:hypothetical protein